MENTDEIIRLVAKEAIKEFDKEQKEKKKKKVFHNTKLLLKHYNSLKTHVEEAIDDVKKIHVDSEIDDICSDELYITSIKRSKSKTLIMIAHIDMALDQLKRKQIKKGTVDKYNALTKHYIDEKTMRKYQKNLNVVL